jgi:hypothetical protein
VIVRSQCVRCLRAPIPSLAELAAYLETAGPHDLSGVAQCLRCHCDTCERTPRTSTQPKELP